MVVGEDVFVNLRPVDVDVDNFGLAGEGFGLEGHPVGEPAAHGDEQVTLVAGHQHQMWSIQHFHFDYPGQLLTSGGFGTMGFGLGAAIGAKGTMPRVPLLNTTVMMGRP